MEGFNQLGGVGNRMAQGFLAHPGQHRASLGGFDLHAGLGLLPVTLPREHRDVVSRRRRVLALWL